MSASDGKTVSRAWRENEKAPVCPGLSDWPSNSPDVVPPRGAELSDDSSENSTVVSEGGAESGAVGAENGVLSVPDDPRLLGLIDAWWTLSEDARDALARMAGLRPDDLHDVDDSTAATARGEGLLS